MACRLYGKSVKGATHIRNGQPLQDSFKIEEISPNLTVLAVADGHGSSKSPKSKNGSQIAVNTFCKIMGYYIANYSQNIDDLVTCLNREGDTKFAQAICDEWQKRVRESFNKSKEEKPCLENGEIDWKSVYQMYGTTLLGMLITKSFVFSFQIGDGDIVLVDSDNVFPLVEPEKFLGTETHSLSKIDAWKNAVTAISRKDAEDGTPYLYMLSTDGFINSYISEEEYKKSCKGYLDMIVEHGFDKVSENIESWLNETSKLGCGDDITLVLAFFG